MTSTTEKLQCPSTWILEEGIYQIKLAEVKGEYSYGYDNGVLAMQPPYHDRDTRDESSRFVHLRHPLDRVQYPHACWRLILLENGSYRIQLYQDFRTNDNTQDPFRNCVLTVHKVPDLRDERDQDSWYVHARPPRDPHTHGQTWKIVPSDHGTFKIQLSDTGELLALHNHYDGDHRDENSAYVHVRKDDCHTHNTNWIISLVNERELLEQKSQELKDANLRLECVERNVVTKTREIEALKVHVADQQKRLAKYRKGLVSVTGLVSMTGLVVVSAVPFMVELNAVEFQNVCQGLASLVVAVGVAFFLTKSKLPDALVRAVVEPGAITANATADVNLGTLGAVVQPGAVATTVQEGALSTSVHAPVEARGNLRLW